jgi:valyl-tRNA synthetase
MASELAKAYDPTTVQREVSAVWTDEKCFHAEPTDPGEPYAIVIPPPNVTAALHLGHALNNTLQDILVRRARMQGRNAVWLPGTDHAGIATQTVVEKRVLKEEGKRRTDFDRDSFVSRIQQWKDEYEKVILSQLQAMGCSCDWDRTAFTMDAPRARAVREAFFQLFKAGLIYRGKRLVNWDPVTQTALADDEVEMEELDGHFYYLQYPLADGSGHVTVATTRPETMLGDTAVAINPTDPRAAALRGKSLRLPIVNRLIPIIEDEYVVKPVSLGGDPADPKAQMATGFLKVTPAHDPNDYDIGIRHQLPIVNVLSPTATISRDHGWPAEEWIDGFGNEADELLGLDRYEARRAVVEWFRREKLLEEVKPYRHSVGHSYRSHVPIEPYLSDQWYCRVTDARLAGAALASMNPAQRSETGGRPNEPRPSGSGPAGTNEPRPSGSGPAGVNEPRPSGSGAASDKPHGSALAYFITFTTYGQHLHGHPEGSVDRSHNLPGTEVLEASESREHYEASQLRAEPFALSSLEQRQAVQEAIVEVCTHRGWELLVLHVRTTHVHVIVAAEATPERVMNDFKSYATRRLRAAAGTPEDAAVWTRHGSTRYLNREDDVEAARRYVLNQQGGELEPAPVGTILEQPLPHGLRRAQSSRRGSLESSQPLPHGRGSLQMASDSLDVLTFYPERYAKTFQAWHENIRDWCISRQLWWGHRIPVWRLRFGRLGERLSPTAHTLILEQAKKWSAEGRIAIQYRGEIVPALPADQHDPHLPFGFVCVRDPDNDPDIVHALHSLGYEQDPDVLDTWFSSGLWPLSTLGWPDATDDLETWNPTHVLCTAREIITLWVSRMVMFNQFFAKRLPFTDVFIHAMIQDGEGRKMSKSLGNGVDPLDIIATHGADAMRFTLASMATNTQDVRMPVVRDEATGRNTSPKFDLGRNVCNKLWNAARFVLMSIQSVPPEPVDELKWTMADRWIVSRFNRTMEEANDALAHYRFDQYAKACYDFFWRDFCDWYVECAKVQLKNQATRAQTANVLASTLDAALRLLHPAVPFVTERLWWNLNEVRPRRGIPGRIACPQPEDGPRFQRVIKAPWPSVGDVSQAAEFIFPKIQDVIAAIRTIRSDYKVDARRVVTVSVRAPGDAARQIELLRGQIELLAACRIAAVAADVAEPASCAKATAAGCEVFVEGLVDESAEQQRVARRRDELTRQIEAMRKRLGNEGYIAKAPANLVQQTKDQLAAAEAELARLG